MNIFSIVVDIVLAAYIARECILFIPRYRRLKEEVAKGDPQARARIYREALMFEWVSAGLAAIALWFDWRMLNPSGLNLDSSRLMQALTPPEGFTKGALPGLIFGLLLGTAAMIVLRLRRRRAAVAAQGAAPARLRRLMPDFSALIPVTKRERLLWVPVALSAGICEEAVFRGWLLATLHHVVGVQGTTLLITAAVLFGLAHAYQKITGIVLTGLVGMLFCLLYVKTGSLLLPILLHCLIDVRFAILPAPRVDNAQAAYA